MSRFLNVLRSWLVMVSVIAAGNTLQSFRDHSFLSEKLYTASPGLVNGLQARTFGVWTLLSSVIRCLCAIDIRNRTYVEKHWRNPLPLLPDALHLLFGPYSLSLRGLHLPHCSLDNWSYGTPHGSKFLHLGNVDWAAVSGGRSTVTKQEEKLKPRPFVGQHCLILLPDIHEISAELLQNTSLTDVSVLDSFNHSSLPSVDSCPSNISTDRCQRPSPRGVCVKACGGEQFGGWRRGGTVLGMPSALIPDVLVRRCRRATQDPLNTLDQKESMCCPWHYSVTCMCVFFRGHF
ncbi:ergosterol biosynthetic protein 28 homolog isoform X1 [Pogoniulus pusillus]|uniref:ergosterol biosynthetic protein 28 homolog isoform X1 n=1 Tax=Pogoniulus pusillus TaxID=488313 RepID=UPI0030B9A871